MREKLDLLFVIQLANYFQSFFFYFGIMMKQDMNKKIYQYHLRIAHFKNKKGIANISSSILKFYEILLHNTHTHCITIYKNVAIGIIRHKTIKLFPFCVNGKKKKSQ